MIALYIIAIIVALLIGMSIISEIGIVMIALLIILIISIKILIQMEDIY